MALAGHVLDMSPHDNLTLLLLSVGKQTGDRETSITYYYCNFLKQNSCV
jgi:hypothetical protein